MNTSLGMGLSIASKLEGECLCNASLSMGLSITSKLEGKCLDGCGMVVAQWSEHWQLKPGALGSIPGSCPDVFSSSKLSDVDGVMSSVVL